MWWPRAWRRPNDIWRRLPWQARAVRASLSAIFVLLPTVVLVRERFGVPGQSRVQPILTTEVALVVLALAIIGASLLWAAARGLSSADGARLLFGSTAPVPAWSSPSYAGLLAPAAGRLRQPDRDTPSDYARAISDLLATISPAGATAADDGAATARRLVGAIGECDGEIAAIGRIANRDDAERLAARLETLEESDAPTGGARESEMRTLVRRQLDLMEELRAECELIAQRRSRLFDFLRALWAQLSPLAAVTDSAQLPAAIERIGTLCREIDLVLNRGSRELHTTDSRRPTRMTHGS